MVFVAETTHTQTEHTQYTQCVDSLFTTLSVFTPDDSLAESRSAGTSRVELSAQNMDEECVFAVDDARRFCGRVTKTFAIYH